MNSGKWLECQQWTDMLDQYMYVILCAVTHNFIFQPRRVSIL